MKRILALILTAVLISLLVIPVGTALADKDFHTIRLALSLTTEGEDDGHPLRNGMVMKTHAEGPNNFYIMSFILNGAMPNTTYDVSWKCWVWGPNIGLPEGWVDYYDMFLGPFGYSEAYLGHSIQTDKNGNGQLHCKRSPEEVWAMGVIPDTTLKFQLTFISDGEVVEVIPGTGILAVDGGDCVFETDVFEAYFDGDW